MKVEGRPLTVAPMDGFDGLTRPGPNMAEMSH